MKPAEKIEAIRAAYRPGSSTAVIAQALGVSRSSILSIYHRNKKLAADCPLPPPLKSNKPKSSKIAPVQRRQKTVASAKPNIPMPMALIPKPVVMQDSLNVTLENLGTGCKWPVNDGGPFLFCGCRRNEHKSYCDWHALSAKANASPG